MHLYEQHCLRSSVPASPSAAETQERIWMTSSCVQRERIMPTYLPGTLGTTLMRRMRREDGPAILS